MAGYFVHLFQDFCSEDEMRDYAYDKVGSPSRANGREGRVLIMGETHGCSCCSTTREVTLQDIEDHISSLKEDLAEAEKVKVILEQQRLLKKK